jgi:maleate isomerase
MFGWRARIGLMLPMDNTVMEPELYSLGLHGISYNAIRIDTTERTEMPGAGIRLSQGFAEMGVDVVTYCCAETAFLKGTEGNAWIAGEITKTTGLPATTAMSAKLAALAALDAKRITLITPYTAAREQVMIDFFKRMGVTVVTALSRDFNEGVGDHREWYQTNLQAAFTAYQMARTADTAGADAVVISATNFRTLDVIAQLERDLGKPVVTTNQALLWQSLGLLGIQEKGPHLGRLMTLPLPTEARV